MRDVLRRETRKAFGFGFCCGRDAWSAETFMHSIESRSHSPSVLVNYRPAGLCVGVFSNERGARPEAVGASLLANRPQRRYRRVILREQARSYKMRRPCCPDPAPQRYRSAPRARTNNPIRYRFAPSPSMTPTPISGARRSTPPTSNHFAILGTASAYLHAWIIGSKNPQGNIPCAWCPLPAHR